MLANFKSRVEDIVGSVSPGHLKILLVYLQTMNAVNAIWPNLIMGDAMRYLNITNVKTSGTNTTFGIKLCKRVGTALPLPNADRPGERDDHGDYPANHPFDNHRHRHDDRSWHHETLRQNEE